MGHETPAFFDRTYQEALGLLEEARDYVQASRAAPRPLGSVDEASPEGQLTAAREAFRLTTRLTQVMSWLMVQRAVLEGELTPREAAEPAWQLGARGLCRDDSGHRHESIPAPMRDLLDRSHHLYVRVSRLDELSRRSRGTSRPTPH